MATSTSPTSNISSTTPDKDNNNNNIFKRLIRDAFSEILTLKERLQKIETKTQKTNGNTLSSYINGKLNFTLAFKRNDIGNNMDQLFDAKPLCKLNFNFPIEKLNTDVSMQISSKSEENLEFKLDKVLLKKEFFDGSMRISVAPIGANGEDLVPTMNPNAEGALSKVISKGCPVHQQISNASALGLRLGKAGNALVSGLFLNKGLNRDEIELNTLNEAILTPAQNLTFALFCSQKLTRKLNIDNYFSSFGIPLAQSESNCEIQANNGIKLGALGAININDDYVLSGWYSKKCSYSQDVIKSEFDSAGICISAYQYPESACPKLGFQIKNQKNVNVITMEFSSNKMIGKHVEFCPGIVASFTGGRNVTACGLKTTFNF